MQVVETSLYAHCTPRPLPLQARETNMGRGCRSAEVGRRFSRPSRSLRFAARRSRQRRQRPREPDEPAQRVLRPVRHTCAVRPGDARVALSDARLLRLEGDEGCGRPRRAAIPVEGGRADAAHRRVAVELRQVERRPRGRRPRGPPVAIRPPCRGVDAVLAARSRLVRCLRGSRICSLSWTSSTPGFASGTRRCIRACGRVCRPARDRKSTRLNSSHVKISYAVFCLKKKKKKCTSFFLLKKKKYHKYNHQR